MGSMYGIFAYIWLMYPMGIIVMFHRHVPQLCAATRHIYHSSIWYLSMKVNAISLCTAHHQIRDSNFWRSWNNRSDSPWWPNFRLPYWWPTFGVWSPKFGINLFGIFFYWEVQSTNDGKSKAQPYPQEIWKKLQTFRRKCPSKCQSSQNRSRKRYVNHCKVI